MTITTTQSRITYSGDNVTTVFPIPFEFFLNSDITAAKAAVGGGVAILVQNVDYTLSGAGVVSGGSATKTTPLLTGETLAFFLNLPITQGSHYLSNGPFPAGTLENDIDRRTQTDQRLNDLLARSIRFPDADLNATSTLLPSAIARALTNMGFDAAGNVSLSKVLASGTLSAASIGAFLYPQTAAEAAAAVTPTALQYPPYNVLRYGADPTGVAVSTTAFTNALAVAVTGGSGYIYVPAGTYLVGALTVTMPGTGGDPRVGPGLRIYGDGPNATIIKQSGSPAGQLLNIQSTTPGSVLADGHVILENFTLFGVGKTCHGLSLQGLADWQLRNVQIHDFDRGLNLQSSLIGHLEGNWAIFSNNTGVYANVNGANSPVNLVSFTDGRLLANVTWGADLVNGSSVRFNGTDFEGNGTVSNTSTGALTIRAGIAAGFGFAQVSFDDVWFEGNFGQCFKVEAATGLTLSFKDCLMLANDAGRDLLIAGAAMVSISDSNMATAAPLAVSNITCAYLHLKNVTFSTLIDASTTPFYENVLANGVVNSWGRPTAWTATIATGLTTTPTAAATSYQQGDESYIHFSTSLTGTSNTTSAFTVTGLPAALRPAFGRGEVMCAFDSGVQSAVYAQLSTAGVLTVGVGKTFANTGVKGLDVCQFRYRINA